MIKEILQTIPLKTVMSSPVITISESADFSAVNDKFDFYDIRHLPVVNGSGGLVGLITQRSLYQIHSPRKLEDGSWYYDTDMLNGFILKNVMIKDVLTLKPESTLAEAVKVVVSYKYGCIPIVDEYKTPVGIVTRDNIFKFLLTQ
ncbi:MAG: CBS domain-containing protein [Candidatus Omnitrophica bacterium]|nr:CBS domain-containing protein [Candidatus Omnitrophota bacterium]